MSVFNLGSKATPVAIKGKTKLKCKCVSPDTLTSTSNQGNPVCESIIVEDAVHEWKEACLKWVAGHPTRSGILTAATQGPGLSTSRLTEIFVDI